MLGSRAAIKKTAKGSPAGDLKGSRSRRGRADASQEETDKESVTVFEPRSDGFRNYGKTYKEFMAPEEALIDKAQLLRLGSAEMTVLLGGLRVLGSQFQEIEARRPRPESREHCANDFFVNLLDVSTEMETVTRRGRRLGRDAIGRPVKSSGPALAWDSHLWLCTRSCARSPRFMALPTGKRSS